MTITPHTWSAHRVEHACAAGRSVDPSRPDRSPVRAGERGVGLLEITVVLVIIMILGGIAFASVGNSKRNSGVTEARTAASNLGEAIEQFQRDHGGRLPAQPATGAAPATADWNATWSSPVDRANRIGTTPQPYLKANAVETLVDNTATLERSDGAVRPGQTNAPIRIRYITDTTRGLYALVVRSRAGKTWTGHCFVSNADPGTASGASFLAPAAKLAGGQRPC